MATGIKVKLAVINNFENDVKAKTAEMDILFEQMINESERIAPFFNTKTGKMLNEKLLEVLNEKKIKFNNNNNVLYDKLVSARNTYEDAIEDTRKSVTT